MQLCVSLLKKLCLSPTGTFGWSTFQGLSATRFRLYQRRLCATKATFFRVFQDPYHYSYIIPELIVFIFQNVCTIVTDQNHMF